MKSTCFIIRLLDLAVVALVVVFSFCEYSSTTTCNGLSTSSPIISSNGGISSASSSGDSSFGPISIIDPTRPIEFYCLPDNACPYAQRTSIVFNELEIPVNIIHVTGSMPNNKPDWFLKINPTGKVPTIRVPTTTTTTTTVTTTTNHQEEEEAVEHEGGAIITESTIINEFLCDYYYASSSIMKNHDDDDDDHDHDRDQKLMPSNNNPIVRAQIRLLNNHCDNVFTKTQFTYLMNKDDDPTKDNDLCKEMEDALCVYEESIHKFGGTYLLGESFTLADIQIYPFIRRLIVTLRHYKAYELPDNKFPLLLNWYNVCSKRKSITDGGDISEEKIIEIYNKFMNMNYKFGGLNQN
jgi:glutathione S-transferase